jgi:hypothetical protein
MFSEMHHMQPRRTSSSSTLLLLIAITGLLASACSENPVGRKCFIGADAGSASQSILASPALECPSRTCLHVPLQAELPEGSEYADLCTGECSGDDECDRVPESPCVSGFTCAVPVVVGPFCCRKMCICKDYLVIPDGGVPVPEACKPDNAANACCNLEGRSGNPDYPNCVN